MKSLVLTEHHLFFSDKYFVMSNLYTVSHTWVHRHILRDVNSSSLLLLFSPRPLLSSSLLFCQRVGVCVHKTEEGRKHLSMGLIILKSFFIPFPHSSRILGRYAHVWHAFLVVSLRFEPQWAPFAQNLTTELRGQL